MKRSNLNIQTISSISYKLQNVKFAMDQETGNYNFNTNILL